MLFWPRLATQMSFMFTLTMIGWVIFRSKSIGQIAYMLTHLAPTPSEFSRTIVFHLCLLVVPLMLLELYLYLKRDLLALAKLAVPSRTLLYSALLISCFVLGSSDGAQFIYFQSF